MTFEEEMVVTRTIKFSDDELDTFDRVFDIADEILAIAFDSEGGWYIGTTELDLEKI